MSIDDCGGILLPADVAAADMDYSTFVDLVAVHNACLHSSVDVGRNSHLILRGCFGNVLFV